MLAPLTSEDDSRAPICQAQRASHTSQLVLGGIFQKTLLPGSDFCVLQVHCHSSLVVCRLSGVCSSSYLDVGIPPSNLGLVNLGGFLYSLEPFVWPISSTTCATTRCHTHTINTGGHSRGSKIVGTICEDKHILKNLCCNSQCKSFDYSQREV